MSDLRPIERPETPEQARTWERVKNRYVRAGLCRRCAAQAAWGHRCGFRLVRDPCPDCAGVDLPDRIRAKHGERVQRWLKAEFVCRDDEGMPGHQE